jgi:hypothetical protein
LAVGNNATNFSAAADKYILEEFGPSRDQNDATKKRVTAFLAYLAAYTKNATAVRNATASRLYDATLRTPASASAPFVMISLGVATVMSMGLAALGLKQFLQNRQNGYSSPARQMKTKLQNDEDEEEAAGFE